MRATQQPDHLLNSAYQRMGDERERQITSDLKRLMELQWGRRLFYWLVWEQSRLAETDFDFSIKDGVSCSLRAAHRDGERAMAAKLLTRIRHSQPELELTMMQEQITERSTLLTHTLGVLQKEANDDDATY